MQGEGQELKPEVPCQKQLLPNSVRLTQGSQGPKCRLLGGRSRKGLRTEAAPQKSVPSPNPTHNRIRRFVYTHGGAGAATFPNLLPRITEFSHFAKAPPTTHPLRPTHLLLSFTALSSCLQPRQRKTLVNCLPSQPHGRLTPEQGGTRGAGHRPSLELWPHLAQQSLEGAALCTQKHPGGALQETLNLWFPEPLTTPT